MKVWIVLLLLAVCGCGDEAPDSDNDGLLDKEEALHNTDPNNPDTDEDGLLDGAEVHQLGTYPDDPDSDSDGLDDGQEIELGTDPTIQDSDSDGISDGTEVNNQTNPLAADSDGDGLSDGEEAELSTNPLAVDTDEDGLGDYEESMGPTNPTNPDTDADELLDGLEAENGCDPLDPDTDDDGFLDGNEVMGGSDPLDPMSGLYIGGWPMNPDQDNVQTSSWNDPPMMGGYFADFKGADQFGDLVHLTDLAFAGKPIVIHRQWHSSTPLSRGLSEFLATDDDSRLNEQAWWSDNRQAHQGIYDLVAEERCFWVTIIHTTLGFENVRAAAEWSEAYPNDNVIVLHDPDGQIHEWYGDGSYFPSISILNENFQFIHYDPDGPLTGLATLLELGL